MRLRVLILGCVSAACLFGQKKLSWQDLCFKNPALPVCKGHDYAVKPPPPAKDTTRSVVTSPFPSTPQAAKTSGVKPAMVMVGAIDWRFADPFADALMGLNFSGLSASPVARSVISLIGAKQGLSEVDLQKIFDGLSGLDQVAISVRNNRMVAMITGSVADSTLPASETGLKMVPVSAGAMLVGHADAVDQAVRRIAMKGPLTELMRSAELRQAGSEMWAMGSAGLMGPQAVSTGLKQFSLSVWIRSRITTDLALEFTGVPGANALRTWQAQLGSAATVEGSSVHVRASMEADEVQQKAGELSTGPLGQGLAALVEAARYLPARDQAVPKQTKPIIYGLDVGGLNDGPK